MVARNEQSDPGAITLMIATLKHHNRFKETMSDAEVATVFNGMREADAIAAANRERDRIAEHLQRRGVDTAGMTDEQVQAKAAELAQADAAAAEERKRQDEIRRQKREQEDRDAERAKRRKRIFAKSDCPELHTGRIGSTDPKNEKFNKILELLSGRLWNGFTVAFLGGRGTGKTQLSVCLIHSSAEQLVTARYVRMMDLFRDLRSAYGPKPKPYQRETETEEDIVDRWAAYGLLVIDEAHNRGNSEFEANALQNLLDRRYAARKSTIFIANQTPQEFASNVGDSIVSRIHESGEVFVFDGGSYRKPGSWRDRPAERRQPRNDHLDPFSR